MPKVSVVVPNYNYGRFLEQRMDSILDQSVQDFEIVYLDDRSTDDSHRVIERFADEPRLRIVQNERNSGNAFQQINKGLRLARGDYVWVAQADDYAARGFLEALVAVLDAQPRVGLAYAQSLAVDEAGRVLHSMQRRTDTLDRERWSRDYVNDGRDECRRYLLFKNTIPNISGVLFRRQALVDAGGVDETLRLSPDWITYVNLLLISDLAFVARPLNYFRHHAGSIRHRSGREGLQIEEAYRVLAHLRERLGLSDAEMEPAFSQLARSWTRKVFRWRGRVSLATTSRIHRTARRVDPRVTRRLVRETLIGWSGQSRVGAPARTARSSDR